MLALFVTLTFYSRNLLSRIYCSQVVLVKLKLIFKGSFFCRCLIFKVRLCPLSRVPCDYITSFRSCQVLFLIFFKFFSGSFLKPYFTWSAELSLKCLHILSQVFPLVNTFFKLFSTFFEVIFSPLYIVFLLVYCN